MVTQVERPLTPAECQKLSRRRERLRRRASGALLKYGTISLVICGVLGVVTVLASDAPPLVIAGFWLAMSMMLTIWTALPERRTNARQAAVLEDALRAKRCREIRIQSRRVVEFEEIEDEGACYAFDAGEGRSIFVIGQQFYADARFPNSNFAIVEVLGSHGQIADEIVEKSGERIEPERRVTADRKKGMEIPDHLEIVAIPIDRVGV